MHQALGAANCSTCKLTTLQRKVGRRLSSGCEPPSFSYGTGQSLGFLFTSSVVGRRVLVLSSGWLASYVGQSEVPALMTSLSSYSYEARFKGENSVTGYGRQIISQIGGFVQSTKTTLLTYPILLFFFSSPSFLFPHSLCPLWRETTTK